MILTSSQHEWAWISSHMILQHGPNQAALAMGQWRKQVDATVSSSC